MSRLHINRYVVRILHKNNLNIQLARLFCTKAIPNLEIDKLAGVTYLNQRLLELRNVENPSELRRLFDHNDCTILRESVLLEIKNLRLQLESQSTPLSATQDKVSKLEQKIDTVIAEIRTLGFKINPQTSNLTAPIDQQSYYKSHNNNYEWTSRASEQNDASHFERTWQDYLISGISTAFIATFLGVIFYSCYTWYQMDKINADFNNAAKHNDLDMIIVLLKRFSKDEFNFNVRNETVRNIMTVIAQKQDTGALSILKTQSLEHEFKYALRDNLELATKERNPKKIEFLLKAGAVALQTN